eukprot:3642785-Rhodomonas_salina.1
MNTTQALGMSSAGKKQININEFDMLLKEQFDAVAKVFTTVDEFTEHLCMCALIKIIKDGVNKPGAVGAAWKAANDRLISMQSKLTPAVGATALATEASKQQHKKKLTCFEDADCDSETVTADQLKAEIAECHSALTALQKTAEGKAEGGGRGRGGGRGGRGGKSQGGFIPKGQGSSGGEAKQPYKPCSICCGKHPGPIAEEAVHHDSYIATVNCMKEQVLDNNPYKELLDLAEEAEPKRESTAQVDMSMLEEVDQRIMQLIQNRWGHQSNSKMEQIVRFYKHKGFPPSFLKALKHFRCKVCAVAKAGR